MVVAKEIRNLAKNTAGATREVAELVGTVQIDITKVGKVMSDGLSKLTQTTELTDNAMIALGEIQKRVAIDKERIQNIANAMTEMQDTSLNVGQAMEHVGHESDRNTSAVEQVNALTQDMTQHLEHVTRLAKSLELMARGEQQMLAKFSLIETN
jgi:methyl-accepting chemotaxis protein